MRTTLERLCQKNRGVEFIAQQTGLTLPALYVLSEFYQIALPQEQMRSPPSERLEQILAAIADGADTYQAVAAITGLKVVSVRAYASQAGISLKDAETRRKVEFIRQALGEGSSIDKIAREVKLSPKGVRQYISKYSLQGAKESTVDRIRGALLGGLDTAEAIAAEIGLRPNSVYAIARRAGLRVISARTKENLQRIQAAAAQSPATREEFVAATGLSRASVIHYVSRFKIALPPTLALGSANLEEAVEQGLSLKECKEVSGLSRQGIYQYLQRTGQLETWKQKQRESKQQRRAVRSQFCSLLEERVQQLVAKQSWAEQKAFEYVRAKKWTTYTLPTLVRVFQNYERAQKKGTKVSLEKLGRLGKPRNLFPSDVRRILTTVGLEAMYWTFQKHTCSLEKKLAAQRVYRSRLSASDIAYFLEVPDYIVTLALSHKGKRERKLRFIVSFGQKKLSYRLASQIYEAKDAGFTGEETAELLGTTSRIVDYALKQQREIKPVIMNALQTMYPKERIRKPYRQK